MTRRERRLRRRTDPVGHALIISSSVSAFDNRWWYVRDVGPLAVNEAVSQCDTYRGAKQALRNHRIRLWAAVDYAEHVEHLAWWNSPEQVTERQIQARIDADGGYP